MRIKLAILESDGVYLDRMVSVFNVKYGDKLEIYSFTDRNAALEALKTTKIDVFLADESFEAKGGELPSDCGFGYLVEEEEIESFKGETAICKFQKAEVIYRRILGIFSENAAVAGLRPEDGGRVLAFLSVGGGVGGSSAAAACAMRFAQKGKSALYLNLERFGSADVFFSAEGSSSLGDVIYAVKSQKGNLEIRLESSVKRDGSGVFFFSPPKLALDTAELNAQEVRRIICTLKRSGTYDYIIADFDFSMEREQLAVLEECDSIIFVADGAQMSNVKMERMLESLEVLEQQEGVKLLMRSGILYNRFSSQTSQKVKAAGIKEYGGIKRFEGCSARQLLRQLMDQPVFDELG